MEKKDLKTLALLGMAGGLLLTAQAINANESDLQADYSNYLAAQGCASCGSHKNKQAKKNTKDNEVADTYQPAGHGCGGYSNPSYYQQSGASHGCGGQQPYYSNQQSGSYQGYETQGGQYYDPSVSQNQGWRPVQQPSQGQYQYQQTQPQNQPYGSGSNTSQTQYQPQTSTKTYK